MAFLAALDARLIAHVLVDDEGDDAARDRPEDQIEPGVLLTERREKGVEEGTGDGVEAIHEHALHGPRSDFGDYRDVAEALELLLDVLVALGVLEVLQLALDDVGDELLHCRVAGDVRHLLGSLVDVLVELDLRTTEHLGLLRRRQFAKMDRPTIPSAGGRP